LKKFGKPWAGSKGAFLLAGSPEPKVFFPKTRGTPAKKILAKIKERVNGTLITLPPELTRKVNFSGK